MAAILKRIAGFGVTETSKDKRSTVIAYEPRYLDEILHLIIHKEFYQIKMNNTLGEIWHIRNGKPFLKISFPLNLYQFVIKLYNSIQK